MGRHHRDGSSEEHRQPAFGLKPGGRAVRCRAFQGGAERLRLEVRSAVGLRQPDRVLGLRGGILPRRLGRRGFPSLALAYVLAHHGALGCRPDRSRRRLSYMLADRGRARQKTVRKRPAGHRMLAGALYPAGCWPGVHQSPYFAGRGWRVALVLTGGLLAMSWGGGSCRTPGDGLPDALRREAGTSWRRCQRFDGWRRASNCGRFPGVRISDRTIGRAEVADESWAKIQESWDQASTRNVDLRQGRSHKIADVVKRLTRGCIVTCSHILRGKRIKEVADWASAAVVVRLYGPSLGRNCGAKGAENRGR